MIRTKYVDTIIGTVGDEKTRSIHGGGKVHPGACVPGGMVQLSPDTVTGGDNGTGYNYCQNTIEGFSFNHMSGIGWYGDLGNLQIMPITGQTDLRSGSNAEVPFIKGTEGWKSQFSHDNEITKAGYYSVLLDKYNIKAEATVSTHCGMLRFTYPYKSDAKVIFNFSRRIAGHADWQSVEIVDDKTIRGSIKCTKTGGGFGRGGGGIEYTLYFYLKTSTPIKSHRFFENEEYKSHLDCYEGEDVGLEVCFGKKNKPLTISCGISYTDIESAENNYNVEALSVEFDEMHKKAVESWEEALSCVEVAGDDDTDLTLFYTCLYHTLLDPRTHIDVDGRFKMSDGSIHTANYTQRTMFSGWDVYRSEFPLLTLINPKTVNDEVNSLLAIALNKNTSFPKWELMGIDSKCMVGDPGLIVVADAFCKGIRNYDVKKAYEIALASAKCEKELFGKEFHSVRPEKYEYTDTYLKDAFVPGQLSLTLELLMADYAMYKFSLAMGRKDEAEHFLGRVLKYKENYNHSFGFMSPRNKDGSFPKIDNEYCFDGCVESNIFQQSWFVPYDVEGLANLFGRDRMVELLERLFSKADLSALWNEDYNHSNEPCHNITHYFNFLELPKRTQYWTRQVQKNAYRLGAFGFCGNEDVGQLSAWYVLSAIGFAQVSMCDDRFQINTPLFKSSKIKLDKDYHSCSVDSFFEIICDKDPIKYPYIKNILLNNKEIKRYYLTYGEITSGGKLELILEK